MVEDTTAKVEVPLRPSGLQQSLLNLYFLLALSFLIFVGIGGLLSYEVPDGMFELKDGTLIKLEDFNPALHGPFPKCHSNHGLHLGSDGVEYVANDKVETAPFPVGHPSNPEWLNKVEEESDRLSLKSLQPSIHLLVVSTLVMLIGCMHAVWLYAKPGPDDRDFDSTEPEIGQSALKESDAYMFPLMGSVVLFSLFVVYKFLDADWLKFLFSAYVVVISVNALAVNTAQYVALRSNSKSLNHFSALFTIPYVDLRITSVDVVAFALASLLGVGYLLTKSWIINNLMGLSFCILGLKHIGLSSFKTGAILLVGLFFYDVFWVFGSKSVFGSNVMVTVATGVEAPIKLMFPRGQDGCGKLQFSMLGLGDIVVPGIFMGLLAKFDVSRSENAATTVSPVSFIYLHSVMVAYVLSLVTTVLVMLVFNAAQPALLYIVPYILIASSGMAVYKGEFLKLLAFEVEDTTENEEEEKEKTE